MGCQLSCPDPSSACGDFTTWDTSHAFGKCTAPNPSSFCGDNTTWDAVAKKCTTPDPASFCPTDFRWNGEKCTQRVKPISELRLGSNSNPPYGYKAKGGSGDCKCTGNGVGINSCGDLCCESSPNNSLIEEDGIQYYDGDESKLCWERDLSIE